MTNTRVKIAALIGLAFCILTPPALARLEDAPWHTFHHGPNHTGLSTHNGPDTAIVKWAFPTGDRIYGSASIGEDGTVYIGTNSELCAIHPNATDPDGDTLTYSCNRTNLFTDFDPIVGTGNWTTDYNDSGVYWVDFGVSDTAGGIANETIRIEVLNINRPPILDTIGYRTVSEDAFIEFTVNASDAMTYTTSNLPDGAEFDTGNGKFSWTPGFDQEGTHPDICFEVTGGELTDSENIIITVENTDRAPVLDYIGDKTVNEGILIEFIVNASDPDGDALVYSASNLPAGAVFNSTTQTFSWTPAFGQAGPHPSVRFEASDGELTDYENITIVVNTTNRPPVIERVGDKTVDENSLLEFTITASDPDGDALTCSASNLPVGAEFNSGTRSFSWIPTSDQAETYIDVHFEVSDSELTDWEGITIDNGAGTIAFAATRLDVATGVTTPGTLAVVKFTTIRKGECSDLTLTEVVVADKDGEEIDPVDITSSSICVDENQPPAAVGKSIHRFNNKGEKYICKVYFNGAESYDPDGEVVYWRWGFGDGNYSTGDLKDHVYHNWRWNGTGYDPFVAILTVTDGGDPHQLDDNASIEVIVYIAGDANGDGIVNILDATIVGLEWGEETVCGAYCWEGNERADRADEQRLRGKHP